jgi:CubicO group peptidase (beta-lactamase class C family)
MLRILLALLLLGIPAQAPKATPADPATVAAKADEYMQAQLAHNGFSGTVLMASNGKPLIAKGYGFANVEWQIPNAPDTKFRIGSITKQFTSMVIMQLREQGKVKLEDSVCVHVTPCPDAWKPVTIHHLLNHTSGIPTYTGIAEWRKVNMQPTYNNSGYFLLGVVIEKITGKKYQEAVRDMILAPLGLNDTGYDWTSTIIPKRASGYTGTGKNVLNAAPLDMQQPYAAGALYSTVEDLLKWDQALYTEKLLPEAAKAKMWTPGLQNYAYGWSVPPPSPASFGHQRIQHSGGINGFSAFLIRVPDVRATVIVLSNNGSSSGAVANDLLAIFFGQPYKMPQPK